MLPSKQRCYEHTRYLLIVQVPSSVHLCSNQRVTAIQTDPPCLRCPVRCRGTRDVMMKSTAVG